MLLKRFKTLFQDPDQGTSEPEIRHRKDLACAALMLEVARADFDQSEDEVALLMAHFKDQLSLSRDEVNWLIETAEGNVDEAVSLYEFTRIVKEECSPDERIALIGVMWRIAHADSVINKHEEHIIRRVAELIYVSHGDFIRLKHEPQL